jgi:biotin operon repressor
MKKWHLMKAKTSDRKFDSGKKVVDQLDLSKVGASAAK